MVDHVAKPIDPEALFRTVAHWLRIAPPVFVPEPAASGAPVPHIEGLDVEAGLQRVAGDGQLYLELLRLFADRQGRTTDEVAAALARGDWSNAERLVHSARGAAGNLGFTALQTVAGPLEQAIRAGRQPGELLQTFGARLDEAVAGIADALSHVVATEAGPLEVPPPAELEHQAGRLARMLEDSDGEVLDFLVARADVVHAVFAGRGPGEFERAVQSFDFDQALDLLHHAASAQGLSLGVMR